MDKIKNRPETYCSRAKKVDKKLNTAVRGVAAQDSRKEFKVDSNGYFTWSSDNVEKKI